MKTKYLLIHEHRHGTSHYFFSSYHNFSGAGTMHGEEPEGELKELIEFLNIDYDHVEGASESIEIVEIDSVFVEFEPKNS